ncbi:fructose bisphosphate aldolase [Psychrobacter sp. HD31]|uniref:fructose bisphosphate aldolase n=1 Tax=Psychrobacter sp. HD31 TaxID=3112003 RepID=UPI003DA61F5F
MSFSEQTQRIANDDGFIAALDQSGGSTPKALKIYGVNEDEYTNEEEMFTKVHEMRTRIMTCDAFTSERVLGAILFENTMDRQVNGKPTANYLWEDKNVVPFLKVDKGLADEENGVQLMKPMPDLEALLDKAKAYPIFGTKMRSVIHTANADAIEAVVSQQFDVAKRILAKGFMPIIEPEVNIESADKAESEALLKASFLKHLDELPADQKVMFKLTLPEVAGFYQELIDHPKVLKVVALSGGYSRDESCQRLTDNKGIIASFSRAFTQGLAKAQSEDEFASTMDATIDMIYSASKS